MSEFKLNVCSMGHPQDAKTWSATPYNLCNELAALGVLGKAHDITFSENKFMSFLLKVSSRIYYGNSKDISRGIFFRNYRSKKISRLVRKNSHTLHFGLAAAPFPSKRKDQHHYLYIDSTWNLWSSQLLNRDGYSLRLWKDAENVEFKSYYNFTHIFSISECVKDNLISHYGISPDKITVVGTGRGVLEPYFGPKDYKNGKILFTAKGRFSDKGGDLVIDAFEQVQKVNPNVQLTIVGQEEYSEKISLPGITTLGFVTLPELQELFNSHSIFIMPALNEPWGLVYIEALSCRMPIVGLRRNAFPEISGDGKYGYIIDVPDSGEVAQLLIDIIAKPLELEEKGRIGQNNCLDSFTWTKVCSEIIDKIKRNYLTE